MVKEINQTNERGTSRRSFLTGAALAGAGLGLGALTGANSAFGKTTGGDPCESVQEIINIAATAEALAVTLLGEALQNAASGKLALNDEQQQALRAARAQEQEHYAHLTRLGAKASTTTFTLSDPKIVTDVPTFLKTLIALEEDSIALYLAAAQEFAILGHPERSELALAITSVEAAHRMAARSFAIDAGVITGLPNDVAFQQAKFSSVGQATAALREMGFIGGEGTGLTYPGPGAIDYSGMKDLTP